MEHPKYLKWRRVFGFNIYIIFQFLNKSFIIVQRPSDNPLKCFIPFDLVFIYCIFPFFMFGVKIGAGAN